jgi:hypothetical protein
VRSVQLLVAASSHSSAGVRDEGSIHVGFITNRHARTASTAIVTEAPVL